MDKNELGIDEKKKISLDILKYVRDFCENNNIRYYLAYGTLLGAVRHGGFIPWDDDIDLLIPRPDYERLLSSFEETSEYRVLSCYNTKDYVMPFAKIHNVKTLMKLPSGKKIYQGVGIDLFPMDGIPNGLSIDKAESIFIKKNDIFLYDVDKYATFKFLTPKTIKEHMKVMAYNIYVNSGVLNMKARAISRNPFDSEYDKCDRVALAVGSHSGIFYPYKKEWYEPINIEFENEYFKAPANYDAVLSLVYSDYMKLPPEEKRVSTHIARYYFNDEYELKMKGDQI